MNFNILLEQIKCLHQDTILHWQNTPIAIQNEGLLQAIEENHAFNFQLWQAEDRARREDKGHTFVYEAKRAIDHFNQQRNNRMETIDEYFAQMISLSQSPDCPVHSETPGMIIDRLSILSLKMYHMRVQATRADADIEHHQRCRHKLQTLIAQHEQLNSCLQQLLSDLVAQNRTFRRYLQFKMYNDPTLNPELYSQE